MFIIIIISFDELLLIKLYIYIKGKGINTSSNYRKWYVNLLSYFWDISAPVIRNLEHIYLYTNEHIHVIILSIKSIFIKY